jgi:hypothetical protein
MSTLVQLEARVSARLYDLANVLWSLPAIDEALRTALADYSAAYPLTLDSTITLAATGRELDISSLTGLLSVLDVWWPYATSPEVWPPNQVPGFHLWWNNSLPKLLISSQSGAQPQSGDVVRIWYTKQHTISSLDGAGTTSIVPLHETGVVAGAAAYAVVGELHRQLGTVGVNKAVAPGSSTGVDTTQLTLLNTWAAERLVDFRAWLLEIHAFAATAGALKHTIAIRNAGTP